MYKYEVIGTLAGINAGLISDLSKDQVRRRKGSLVETSKAGVYEVKKPIMFKNGETFSHDGILNPKLGQVMACSVEAAKPVLEPEHIQIDKASNKIPKNATTTKTKLKITG